MYIYNISMHIYMYMYMYMYIYMHRTERAGQHSREDVLAKKTRRDTTGEVARTSRRDTTDEEAHGDRKHWSVLTHLVGQAKCCFLVAFVGLLAFSSSDVLGRHLVLVGRCADGWAGDWHESAS